MSSTDGPTSGERGSHPHAPTTGAVTVDADGQEIPVDLAAWIDERDPEPVIEEAEDLDDIDDLDGPADVDATRSGQRLDEQRAEHEPAGRDADEAVGALVNNVGDDGGAATG